MLKVMNKKFIFKYEPQSSVKEVFVHLEAAVKTGQKHIQPKNVSITNNLAVINRILSKARLELFSMVREKQPNNIQELSQLLQRDYANVWRDCQVLASCRIIDLKKNDQEMQNITRGQMQSIAGNQIRPIALYDQIVIDFPMLVNKDSRSVVQPPVSK